VVRSGFPSSAPRVEQRTQHLVAGLEDRQIGQERVLGRQLVDQSASIWWPAWAACAKVVLTPPEAAVAWSP